MGILYRKVICIETYCDYGTAVSTLLPKYVKRCIERPAGDLPRISGLDTHSKVVQAGSALGMITPKPFPWYVHTASDTGTGI